MRTPDVLTALIRQRPTEVESFDPVVDVGWLSAFARACREIEEGLAWRDDANARALWEREVATIECFTNHARYQVGWDQPALVSIHLRLSDLRRLEELAHRYWIGVRQGRVAELRFMTNPDLRRIAERDLGALAIALRTEQPKTTLTTAGFVIEAVLLDVLEQHSTSAVAAAAAAVAISYKAAGKSLGKKFAPTDPPEEWTFHQMIHVSGPTPGLEVLSARPLEMADTLRGWRNIVHPAVERKELAGTVLDMSDGLMAQALLQKIVAEVDRVRGAPGFVLPWSS